MASSDADPEPMEEEEEEEGLKQSLADLLAELSKNKNLQLQGH